ncbi:MAG: PD-(D/E)XK nuclease family protein [Candidatus Obscuribacterales bacterium]|nr:PD-(D/E)XK nuclease family protein [Candidatus Obscuribacterales bacterium]
MSAAIMQNAPTDISLLLGPYRCAKSSELLQNLLLLKEEDPFASVLILVPSARYGKLFKERLTKCIKDRAGQNASLGFFGLDIQPFYQTCLSILSKRGPEPRLIPEELRPALLSKLLSEMKSEGRLSTLNRIAEFHGTGAYVLELIDELQRSGLTPEDVLATLELSSCSESHLQELARIYEAYFQRLKDLDYYDQKSLALAAREELYSPDSKFGREKNYDLLLIDGFDRVSHLQAQVFAGLAGQSRKTLMAFDYALPGSIGSERSAYQQTALDYRWKESSYNELTVSLRAQVHERKLPDSSANQLQVKAITVLDPFLEMSELAREVKTAIVSRKVDPSEIAVVLRSPESYNGAVEAAFDDAGISYFMDGSNNISNLEPWRFIVRLFTLQDHEFRRKNLIDILRSPYMNLEGISMTARDLSILDRNTYEAGLVGGAAHWKRFLRKEAYEQFAVKLIEMLSLLDFDQNYRSAREHSLSVENIIEKFMIFPESELDLRSLAAVEERESIKALRRCLKLLMLQEEILNQEAETFKQFWSRLIKLAERTNYARPRPDNPAVLICSAELVPNRRFQEIYIAGLVEGEFPKHQSSTGFLSPDEIRLWLSYGIDIRNPRQEPGFERALFYSLCERASSRLHLSLPQFSGKAEETLPSFYLTELFEKTGLMVTPLQAFARSAEQALSVRDALSHALWWQGVEAAEELAQSERAVNKRWQSLKFGIAAFLNRSQQQKENLYNGYLRDLVENKALQIPLPARWTPSKINDYGKCPFRFWASHIMSLKPREEAEPGLNFALIGQFYHKVLELFYASLLPLETQEQESAWKDLQEKAFQKALNWLELNPEFQAGPYWEQEKKDLQFRIMRFIDREQLRLSESDFQPRMFEVNFGTSNSSSFPALTLPSKKGEEIVLSGSIDRVDLPRPGSASADSARVIDYKSSSRAISAKEALSGRNLQLPIYALAIEKSILPKSKVTEAHYLSISAAKTVGQIKFDSEKHQHLKELAADFIRRYVDDAGKGVFTVKPNGDKVCLDCRHATVCRVAELKPDYQEDEDAASD